MLTRIDLRGREADTRSMLPRAALDVAAAIEVVRPIVEGVRDHGVSAVRAATLRLDHVETPRLRVPRQALRDAAAALDPRVRAAITEAITRAELVHRAQCRETAVTTVVPGGTVTQCWRPVARVGLYVPGGLAVYPSSVVMNVVPAKVAGVASLAVASPPQPATGLPHPLVMATCELLGVDELYAVGGAQAIAMFGYGAAYPAGETGEGTEPIAPVDMITGPGNIWVTAAKRLLRGRVGIDAEAGPTEVAILADDTAVPAHVAADMISQAEHDPMAASVLVTPSEALIEAVEAELAKQVPANKHSERIATALAGPQSAAVLVTDIEAGLRVVDEYAAEHLEIQTSGARELAERVRNAGAVFVGAYAPVSLGDYCAGSNHVLPTGGCAKHSAGLSVQTFLRGVQLIEYSREALQGVADHVVALSEAEDLPAHGQAVKVRFN